MNRKGFSLVSVLISVAVLGITTAGIVKITNNKQQQMQRTSLQDVANQITTNMVNMISSPEIWNKSIDGMQGQFEAYKAVTQHNPNGTKKPEPKIDIKIPSPDNPNGQMYYRTSDARSGFDRYGRPCNVNENPFSADLGNDNCPFRYEVTYVTSQMINGNNVDTVRITMQFKPRSSTFILNGSAAKHSFLFARNFSQTSVETSCIGIGGVYDKDSAMCSKVITPKGECADGQGQAISGANQEMTSVECATINALTTCPTGQAITGISASGTPICETLPQGGGNI